MKRIVALAIGGLIVGGALAGALIFAVGLESQPQAFQPTNDPGPYRGSEPPGTHPLPEFTLRAHDGETVRSGDLRGKVLLLTFLDSQCTESCPILALQIAEGLDRLGADEREEVVAVAISTDATEDTRESVRSFLAKQGALGELVYLTGPATEIRRLWKRFKILSSDESGSDALHSAPLRIYGRDLVWAATLHPRIDLNPENLVHDIRVALKEGQ